MVEVVDDGLKVLHVLRTYSPTSFFQLVYCDILKTKFRLFAFM